MVRICRTLGASISTICRSVSGMGTFSTMVRPRATSRSLTRSMTSSTSSTISSPWRDTAPDWSPVRIRWRTCWARVLIRTQRSANSGEAMNSRTSRSTRPLMAAVSGPTSSCSRGRVGDDAGEHVVEDRLDVDLLLDRGGDLGRDDVLDLGRVRPAVRRCRRTAGRRSGSAAPSTPPPPASSAGPPAPGRSTAAIDRLRDGRCGGAVRRAGGPGTGNPARSLCGTWTLPSDTPASVARGPGVVTQTM